MSRTASSPRIPPDKPFPPVSLPSTAPLPQFCPKLHALLTPSNLSFVGLVLTRPVRILLMSLAVSPAYIRMNEKRLQREKELLENCELHFLAQKTISSQQCSTEVPGKVTDAPVLGGLGTEGKGCALPFCTALEQPLWIWEPGVHIPTNRHN